jgi:hypothetical protein
VELGCEYEGAAMLTGTGPTVFETELMGIDGVPKPEKINEKAGNEGEKVQKDEL